MKELYIARELILIAKTILSYRYIHDPKHSRKPEGPGWHKTDKGWSDSKLSPPGEKSLLEAVFNDPDFLGKGIELIHQKRIKIYLEKYKGQNPEIIKATEEQFQRSLEKDEENNKQRLMKIDAVIESSEQLSFNIFVEFDESHHYRGEQNRIDRVKDFHARLCEGAIVVRLKSNEKSAELLKEIYSKISENSEKIKNKTLELNSEAEEGMKPFIARSAIQGYVDALCFASEDENLFEKVKDLPPEKCEKVVREEILDSLSKRKKLNKGQRKLLSIWARRIEDLDGIIKAIGADKSKRKGVIVTEEYKGNFYNPYVFMDSIIEELSISSKNIE